VAEGTITLLHVGGKVGTVKWDVAQYKNKDLVSGGNAKFALSTLKCTALYYRSHDC
jgi:hypothetical protein